MRGIQYIRDFTDKLRVITNEEPSNHMTGVLRRLAFCGIMENGLLCRGFAIIADDIIK